MQSLNGKIDGDPGAPGRLPASEWNEAATEVENAIIETGISLTSGDLSQLSKAIANYVSNGAHYTDSGSANAYVLTPIGSNRSPTSYRDGMVVEFETANPNTGASTANLAGLGTVSILLRGGGALSAGDISGRVKLRYDASNTRFELQNPAPQVSTGTNGFVELHPERENSIIVQWGTSAILSDGADQTITLPITFPNAARCLVTSPRVGAGGGTGPEQNSSGIILSNSQINVQNRGNGASFEIYWQCVGF